MTPQPSLAVVVQRLDDLVQRIDRLAQDLQEGYVRRDVQAAREAASALQLQGFEDELHMLGKRVDGTNTRIDDLTRQRDAERDARDKQRASDRRMLLTFVVMGLLSPILTALVLRVLGVWH